MMSTYLSTRASSPDLGALWSSASPIDHALSLFLADETEAALRWGAAALERDPLLPSALIVTSRLLDQMGRTRAAVGGLRLAARRAIEMGDLPVALAAIDDLRILGADAGEHLDQAASAFCRGSVRLQQGQLSRLPHDGDFLEPLSPFLGGPPLASKATQILHAARQAHDAAVGADLPPFAPLPLFSALSQESLRDLLDAFQMITVPAGHPLIREGEDGSAAYIVAQGEVELSRSAAHGENKPRLTLARLGNGAFFGEMALLSRLPSATNVTATRPSILLVGRRDALVAVATKRADVAVQLAAHCRRNSVANLGWTSPVVASIPLEERATLIERLEMRVFERGEKLVTDREEAKGLHLIVSGEVAIVAREWSERVLLATLGAGETVGEVELVLCRQAFADAVAVRPTAALFLSRGEYSALVQDRPAILHGLYATAVRRHAETRLALESGSATVGDDWLLEEEPTATNVLPARVPPRRSLPPPLPPPPLPPPPRAVEHGVRSPAPPAYTREVTSSKGPSAMPSVAPTAASIRAASLTSFGQPSVARVSAVAGAALVASVAGVLFVLALRYDRPRTPAAGISPSIGISPSSAATATVAAPPAENPSVPLSPWKATSRNRPTPKPILIAPRAAAGTPVGAASSAPPADSASTASSASPVATAHGPPGPKLSTRTPPDPDDFGGRE